MISNLESFVERLREIDPESDDFVLQADNPIKDLDPHLGAAVAPAIFDYFETYPNSDMGAAGILVHYLDETAYSKNGQTKSKAKPKHP